MNFSSRGTRTTVGIPGTGFSYSTKVGGSSRFSGSHASSKAHSSSHATVSVPDQVGIQMNDCGRVIIVDGAGNEIADASVVRKIKATPQYKAQVAELDKQRLAKIEEYYADSLAENEKYINIYKLASQVDSASDFSDRLQQIAAEPYEEQKFELPMPTEETIKTFLISEAEHNVQGPFFTVGKLRKKYVEDNLALRYANALSAWNMQRDDFLIQEAENKREYEANAQVECDNQKAFLQALITGNYDAVCEVFDDWIASCELPVEMSINYEWNPRCATMLLDVDLPEIEDLPKTKLTKTNVGNLKEKNKTQAELREEYATLVFGLAIFISSNAFNISPAIKNILISGYTQRRNKDGDICDEYIYSIKFQRDDFEHRSFNYINPKSFCLTAENRCNMTATCLFRKITPFDNI